MEPSRFDEIVAGFYAAATGVCSWNAALSEVHDAFGTRVTALQSVDVSTGRLIDLQYGGPSRDEGRLDYVRHWHKLDPRRARLLEDPSLFIGRWWHCHESFDEHFSARDPFYRHFLVAQETRYLSTTACMPSETVLTALALELPASRGPLNDDERHVLARLGKHVADALRAHERIRKLAVQALAGHGLLDAFSYPMWLLGADRFIYHANPAAQAQRTMGEMVDEHVHRLVFQDDRIDAPFARCLDELLRSRHGVTAIVDARRRIDGGPAWLHLQTLEPVRVLGVFGERPLVLATLFSVDIVGEIDPFALSHLFGMTPTEARVAALLAEGLAAQAIADRLGCAIATVRTHLRRVQAKLGAARSADAARLLRQGEALWSMPVGSRSN